MQNNLARIFPNPVSSNLNIEYTSLIDCFEIINPIGQVVFSRSKIEMRNVNVDVSKLINGMYFIKALDKNSNMIHAKFIKE
jgi:hypothetical protein